MSDQGVDIGAGTPMMSVPSSEGTPPPSPPPTGEAPAGPAESPQGETPPASAAPQVAQTVHMPDGTVVPVEDLIALYQRRDLVPVAEELIRRMEPLVSQEGWEETYNQVMDAILSPQWREYFAPEEPTIDEGDYDPFKVIESLQQKVANLEQQLSSQPQELRNEIYATRYLDEYMPRWIEEFEAKFGELTKEDLQELMQVMQDHYFFEGPPVRLPDGRVVPSSGRWDPVRHGNMLLLAARLSDKFYNRLIDSEIEERTNRAAHARRESPPPASTPRPGPKGGRTEAEQHLADLEAAIDEAVTSGRF